MSSSSIAQMANLPICIDCLLPSRRLRILDVPVHKKPDAVINSRDVMTRASLMLLHCPVEILRLELSRSISKIDLSLGSSRLDPNIGPSCVLDRLVVGHLALVRFSQYT